MAAAQSKNRIYYINLAITVLITFGVGFLPAFGNVTELGMKCLGVFLGSIYGWLTIGLIVPSLLSMLALSLVGFANIQQEFIDGFAYFLVPMMIITFTFVGVISMTGINQWITEWLISRKIIIGRPYVLIAVLFIGAEILAIFQTSFVGVFMLWSIVVALGEEAGYEKHNKFVILMIPALMAVNIAANYLFPFFSGAIMYLSFYTQGTGATIAPLSYILWEAIMINLYIVVFLLFLKFVVKLDLSGVAAASEMYRDKQCPKMTKEQKLGFVLLLSFLIVMLLPSLLPKTWMLTKTLAGLGIFGVLTIILLIMASLKNKDGSPLTSIQKAAETIPWEVIWLLVASTPLAAAFNAEECGIMSTLMGFLTPILTNMNAVVFVAICTIVVGITTQFVHNMIVAIILVPILCPLFAAMGGNSATLFMCLAWALTFAYATPAASMNAALIFGHASLEPKDGYINGFMHLALCLIVAIIVGIPLGNLIF